MRFFGSGAQSAMRQLADNLGGDVGKAQAVMYLQESPVVFRNADTGAWQLDVGRVTEAGELERVTQAVARLGGEAEALRFVEDRASVYERLFQEVNTEFGVQVGRLNNYSPNFQAVKDMSEWLASTDLRKVQFDYERRQAPSSVLGEMLPVVTKALRSGKLDINERGIIARWDDANWAEYKVQFEDAVRSFREDDSWGLLMEDPFAIDQRYASYLERLADNRAVARAFQNENILRVVDQVAAAADAASAAAAASKEGAIRAADAKLRAKARKAARSKARAERESVESEVEDFLDDVEDVLDEAPAVDEEAVPVPGPKDVIDDDTVEAVKEAAREVADVAIAKGATDVGVAANDLIVLGDHPVLDTLRKADMNDATREALIHVYWQSVYSELFPGKAIKFVDGDPVDAVFGEAKSLFLDPVYSPNTAAVEAHTRAAERIAALRKPVGPDGEPLETFMGAVTKQLVDADMALFSKNILSGDRFVQYNKVSELLVQAENLQQLRRKIAREITAPGQRMTVKRIADIDTLGSTELAEAVTRMSKMGKDLDEAMENGVLNEFVMSLRGLKDELGAQIEVVASHVVYNPMRFEGAVPTDGFMVVSPEGLMRVPGGSDEKTVVGLLERWRVDNIEDLTSANYYVSSFGAGDVRRLPVEGMDRPKFRYEVDVQEEQVVPAATVDETLDPLEEARRQVMAETRAENERIREIAKTRIGAPVDAVDEINMEQRLLIAEQDLYKKLSAHLDQMFVEGSQRVRSEQLEKLKRIVEDAPDPEPPKPVAKTLDEAVAQTTEGAGKYSVTRSFNFMLERDGEIENLRRSKTVTFEVDVPLLPDGPIEEKFALLEGMPEYQAPADKAAKKAVSELRARYKDATFVGNDGVSQLDETHSVFANVGMAAKIELVERRAARDAARAASLSESKKNILIQEGMQVRLRQILDAQSLEDLGKIESQIRESYAGLTASEANRQAWGELVLGAKQSRRDDISAHMAAVDAGTVEAGSRIPPSSFADMDAFNIERELERAKYAEEAAQAAEPVSKETEQLAKTAKAKAAADAKDKLAARRAARQQRKADIADARAQGVGRQSVPDWAEDIDEGLESDLSDFTLKAQEFGDDIDTTVEASEEAADRALDVDDLVVEEGKQAEGAAEVFAETADTPEVLATGTTGRKYDDLLPTDMDELSEADATAAELAEERIADQIVEEADAAIAAGELTDEEAWSEDAAEKLSVLQDDTFKMPLPISDEDKALIRRMRILVANSKVRAPKKPKQGEVEWVFSAKEVNYLKDKISQKMTARLDKITSLKEGATARVENAAERGADEAAEVWSEVDEVEDLLFDEGMVLDTLTQKELDKFLQDRLDRVGAAPPSEFAVEMEELVGEVAGEAAPTLSNLSSITFPDLGFYLTQIL